MKVKVKPGKIPTEFPEKLSSMEFIKDITIFLHEDDYKGRGGLENLLVSYRAERKGSLYSVRGTMEELERLSVKLASVNLHSDPGKHRQTGRHDDPPSAPPPSVDVSAGVMAYVQEKCGKELKEITGGRFFMEVQPSLTTSESVTVTVRPGHASSNHAHAAYVLQRFITFYQRTASDLQVASVQVSPHLELTHLQRRFPRLLFTLGCGREVTAAAAGRRQEVIAAAAGRRQEVIAAAAGRRQEVIAAAAGRRQEVIAAAAGRRQEVIAAATGRRQEVTATGPFVVIAELNDFLSGKESPASWSSGPGPEAEPCPICMEPIEPEENRTLKCQHSFCTDCLREAFRFKPVCPTCGQVYGALTGTQPEGGRMSVTTDPSSLPGYENYRTIAIKYHIPNGIQTEEHPNPGQRYKGVSRTAYLPESSEGLRVLDGLRRAFQQRLTFTVGRSCTSNQHNVVTWNDIHHKTSPHGGPTCFGYPDPDYLRRVGEELKAKGIE